MTLDEAIKICEEDAEKIGGNPQSDRHAERCRQIAEWLTELKEWETNPFWRIKTECRKHYYCHKCAFFDHCPFANGNRAAAEYPIDWVIF